MPAKPPSGVLVSVTLAAATLLIVVASALASAPDEDPRLTIRVGGEDRHYSALELLERPERERVTIKDVSAYPREQMTYEAIKLATLLEPFAVDAQSRIEFVARDGFTANIDAALLLNTKPDAAIAYLAIEDPREPWPAHRSGEGTAGPFYLFWINPELSNIGREEWPYKFDLIRITDTLAALYPTLLPEPSHRDAERLEAGFRVYVKNCLACHKLNQVGPGTMGPDLNHPMSPTEYFRDGILRQFIRDPQSVRANPQSPMAGFSQQLISEQELDQLLAYMQYMAQRRRK